MEFKLTYSGPLKTSGNDSRGNTVDHKHGLRLHFHEQLKRLWDTTPFLKSGGRGGPSALVLESSDEFHEFKASVLAKKHEFQGWQFVPLVTSAAPMLCELDILFLRPETPGKIIKVDPPGDIDGRIKTLLDALAKPDVNQGYEKRKDGPGPLYVLLEDDGLITKLSIETGQMLESLPKDVSEGNKDCRLVIGVRIRPYETRLDTLQFV